VFEQRMRVFKIRPAAKLPNRAHAHDAGMDFFFAPDIKKPVLIESGQSAVLQTGLKVEVPQGYMLQVMNKSGVASKRSLLAGACVIDHGYTGEIFINLHNVGRRVQMIEPGMKLAQGVFLPVHNFELELIEEDDIYGEATSRGSGALGSTGE
jgi:dUTP pyrophosphatase